MSRKKYDYFHKGDIIRTNSEKGFYGIAVVLNNPETIEISPGKLSYPLCHIAITPLIFNYEVTIDELLLIKLKPLVFERNALYQDGNIKLWKIETCIYIYTNRNKANLTVIGNIDTSDIYEGELLFHPLEDRFFICGDVKEDLGREAYISYIREKTNS